MRGTVLRAQSARQSSAAHVELHVAAAQVYVNDAAQRIEMAARSAASNFDGMGFQPSNRCTVSDHEAIW